jgi:hypothetical protein
MIMKRRLKEKKEEEKKALRGLGAQGVHFLLMPVCLRQL